MVAYGYGGQPVLDFELDHLISLELGGAPRDPANLAGAMDRFIQCTPEGRGGKLAP